MVKAAAVVGFNPENIISDGLFYDSAAMTSAQIQSFLDAKIGACQNGKCLNVLNVNGVSANAYYSVTTGNLVCNTISGGSMRVSEWIYRVQVACGISAKVILVTLQKEQGLISGSTAQAPSDYRLLAAMGHLCPDTASCDPSVAGPVLQIFKGVEQLKKYKATAFGKQPGRNFVGYSPTASCGGTYLNIQNYATAALYNYTPYQPNAASLAAGMGYGDACSSYGNRNFYNYYTQWFGSPQGAVNPFGSLDVVQAKPGIFHVSGWAIDPDTTGPIDVHVWVDNLSATALKANGDRPDVATVYPAYGAKHGFDADVSAVGNGRRTVCAYAINVLTGGNTQLGCATLDAMSGSPIGYLDSVTAVAGGVRVAGWTIDPDTASAAQVDVAIDGVVSAVRADVSRADIGRLYPAYGSAHGYSSTLPAAVGTHQVCATAKNSGPGADVALGCISVNVTAPADSGAIPRGSFDSASVVGRTVVVGGWAWDPDTAAPVTVRVTSGDQVALATTGGSRPDVATVFPAAGVSRGYSASLRLQPGDREVCATAVNTGLGGDEVLGCRTVSIPAPADTTPIGYLDGVGVTTSGITARGWTFDPDTPAAIGVHVYVDGVVTKGVADAARSDIGTAHPAYGPNHGYSMTISASPGSHRVCAYGIGDSRDANSLLGCANVTVPKPTPDTLPIGYLDSVTVGAGTITASGWTFDPDTPSPIGVHVYVDSTVTKAVADQARSDIARLYPSYGGNHGYAVTAAAAAGKHRVCAYGIGDRVDGNALLGCVDVTVP